MLNRHRRSAGRSAVSRAVAVGLTAVVIALAVVASAAYHFSTSRPESATASTSRGPLILYAADAYALEGQDLLQSFSAQTGVSVAPPKAAGSLVLAQQIAQGNPVSVFMPVSRSAVQPQYLRNQFSGWAIGFAADQMTIAYSNASLRSPAVTPIAAAYARAATSNSTTDWYTFFDDLTSGVVKVGISNPSADPAGFRGWIVLEAAGGAYANSSTYFAQRMLMNAGNVTGSSAADLISPLQAGQIQFLFIYRSAAASQGLHYFQLPDTTNLGNPSMTSFYSKFSYTISTGVQRGTPIVLYIAVPKDSTDFADSVQFVSFVVENAHTILGGYHLTILSPAILYNDTSVPSQISGLVAAGLLALGGTL